MRINGFECARPLALCDMIFAYLNSSVPFGAASLRKVRDGEIVSRLLDGHIRLFTYRIEVYGMLCA